MKNVKMMSIDELKKAERGFLERHGSNTDAWPASIWNAHADVVNEIFLRTEGISGERLKEILHEINTAPDGYKIPLIEL